MKYLYEGSGDYRYKYPMVSATATMVIYNIAYKAIWAGWRSPDSDAYPNKLALPGGFLEPGQETVEECASREAQEETGLVVAPSEWQLFAVHSRPDLDPRSHVINTCLYTKLEPKRCTIAKPGDDMPEGNWFFLDDIVKANIRPFQIAEADKWAFNHSEIIEQALRVIFRKERNNG
jgi:ADP-ribose pyrophosphatase YjhB (NUDIX family)